MGWQGEEELRGPELDIWAQAGPPASRGVDRTVFLPRLYTGETMVIPVETHLLRLRVTAGPDVGRTFSVRDAGAEMGRTPSADIQMIDPAVSRRHARIEFRSGSFHLVDLGSSNGCHVNGERVSTSPLSDGDVLTLGHNTLSVEIAPSA